MAGSVRPVQAGRFALSGQALDGGLRSGREPLAPTAPSSALRAPSPAMREKETPSAVGCAHAGCSASSTVHCAAAGSLLRQRRPHPPFGHLLPRCGRRELHQRSAAPMRGAALPRRCIAQQPEACCANGALIRTSGTFSRDAGEGNSISGRLRPCRMQRFLDGALRSSRKPVAPTAPSSALRAPSPAMREKGVSASQAMRSAPPM